MSALYAWLRRHPMLVDAVLAVMLAPLSLGQIFHESARLAHWPSALAHGPWIRLLAALLIVVAVALRRRIHDTAFALAALSGLIQLTTPTPLPSDIALLVLLYTVAAYRPRRHSAIALLACLGGAVLAVWVWLPPFRGEPTFG